MPNGRPQIQILLVDDDELTREVLTLQMTAQGYHVHPFDSGESAIQHLRQSTSPPPDAVLTDLQMPGLSGLELSRQLRLAAESSGSPAMQLLAMSASHPSDNLFRAFDAFLIKPFTMKQLADTLNRNTTPAALEPTADTASNLDESIFQRLAASIPAAQLQQLYEFCLSDAQTRIARMRLAAANADDATFRKEAHTIKGGCAMVGALELQRLAAEAEHSGLTPANHVVSLDEMLNACDRLRRILVARQNPASL